MGPAATTGAGPTPGPLFPADRAAPGGAGPKARKNRMIIQNAKNAVQAVGTTRVAESRIATSPKMFELLSSTLYSDKIKAVIREISCNASDAHLAAGKPGEPILVHLPTSVDPYFSVRDFGKGLTPDDVAQIYPHYGVSTKEQDAEATGCLGLGSKSPLAYAPTFQVTSWTDKKRVYAVYRDESGTPVTDCLYEGVLDDETGVEVRVIVQPGDFREFEDKAKATYAHFAVTPKGNRDFLKPEYDLDLPLASWKKENYRSYVNYGLVMGNVYYPLDLAQLCGMKLLPDPDDPLGPPVESNFRLPDVIKSSNSNWSMTLKVPVGAVGVTPSRESVSYTPAAVAFLQDHVARAVREVADRHTDALKDCKSLWEARRVVSRSEELAAFGLDLRWNGVGVRTELRLDGELRPPAAPGHPDFVPYLYGSYLPGRSQWGRQVEKPRAEEVSRVFVRDRLRAVAADDFPGAGAQAAAGRYLAGKWKSDGYVLVFRAEQLTPEYLDKLGVPAGEVVKLSEYKLPPAKRAAPVKRASRVRKLGQGGWEDAEIDFEAGGVYVERVRDKYYKNRRGAKELVYPGDTAHVRSLVKTFLGDKAPVVYGLRPSDVETALKSGKWAEYDAFVLGRLTNAPAALKKAASKVQALAAGRDVRKFEELSKFQEAGFRPGSLFLKLVRATRDACGYQKEGPVKAYLELLSYYNLGRPAPDESLRELLTEASKVYPAAFDSNLYYDYPSTVRQLVRAYVEKIDAERARAKRRRPGAKPAEMAVAC